jgi:hypothetical protein
MLSFQIKSIEDFEEAKRVAGTETQKAFAALHKELHTNKTTYAKAAAAAKELGINEELLNGTLKDAAKAHIKLVHVVNKATDAHDRAKMGALETRMQQSLMGRAFSKIAAQGKGVADVLGAIGKVGLVFKFLKAVVELAVLAIKEYVVALRTLVNDSMTSQLRISKDIADSSARMMMTPGQVMQHMSKFRQSMEAGGMSIEQWNKGMVDSSDKMFKYGMSLEDGGKFFSKNAGVFASIAGQNLDEGAAAFKEFASMQEDMYTRLAGSIGTTEAEFSNMTSTLANNESVQKELLKLDKKDRIGRFQQLQQTTLSLKAQGMSIEAATEFAAKLSEMSGGNTKSRLKQAAKTQAIFGAAGLGDLGASMAAEIRRGSRGDKDVLAAGYKQLREVTGEMQQSEDLGMQMYGDQLVEKLDMPDIMKSVEKAITNSGNKVADAVGDLKPSKNASQMQGEDNAALVTAAKFADRSEFYAANWKQLEAQADVAAKFAEDSIEGTTALVTRFNDMAQKAMNATAILVRGAGMEASVLENIAGTAGTAGNGSTAVASKTRLTEHNTGQQLAVLESHKAILEEQLVIQKRAAEITAHTSTADEKAKQTELQKETNKQLTDIAATLAKLNELTSDGLTAAQKTAKAADLANDKAAEKIAQDAKFANNMRLSNMSGF